MPVLRHGGFFHLDVLHINHTVDLLEKALSESSQEVLFNESLLVLPEAFNITGRYYGTGKSDPSVENRLITLSRKFGLCFVVGLIHDDSAQVSEAVLIDGTLREVLSLKTLWDGSPHYKASAQKQDKIILHRGLRIGALICMDAVEGDKQDVREEQKKRHQNLIADFNQYVELKLLCVPARFGASSPVEVAKVWNQQRLSIIIGNCGSFIYPSVMHFNNGKTCTAPTDGGCHVHFGTLPLQREP